MDRFQRIFLLCNILKRHKYPVSCNRLCEQLECSESTVKRIIAELRNFNIPVEYDHEHNGYYFDKRNGDNFELPGLWFSSSELYALLVSQKLLADVQPGWLNDYLEPIQQSIIKLFKTTGSDYAQIERRVRILQIAARPTDLAHFQKIVTALIQRRQLKVLYQSRAADMLTERVLSPQRIIYYRNNWYLDAWCHLRQALRSFSIDRLHPVNLNDTPATEIDDNQLDQHYTAAYGIFAGPATHAAHLRFSAQAAKWVADEHWHAEQHGTVLPDGSYDLQIPYGDPRELLMDILKYGPEVEVLAPQELRDMLRQRLEAALKKYA